MTVLTTMRLGAAATYRWWEGVALTGALIVVFLLVSTFVRDWPATSGRQWPVQVADHQQATPSPRPLPSPGAVVLVGGHR